MAAPNLDISAGPFGIAVLGTAAMAHKEGHIRAARALKDMDPIPTDFATNPGYWP